MTMAGRRQATLTSSRLPRFWEFAAPADVAADRFHQRSAPGGGPTAQTFDAFAAHLRHTPADAVFILGDLFDLWVGDDSRSGRFEAHCVEMHRRCGGAARRSPSWPATAIFWSATRCCKACGAMALADPTVLVAFGQRVLLSHGDALCIGDTGLPAVSRPKSAVRPGKRRFWRSRSRLGSSRRWRSASKASSASARPAASTGSTSIRRRRCAGCTRQGPACWSTAIPIAPAASRWRRGCFVMCLSDWELDDATGADRAEVLSWTAGRFARVAPSTAASGVRADV